MITAETADAVRWVPCDHCQAGVLEECWPPGVHLARLASAYLEGHVGWFTFLRVVDDVPRFTAASLIRIEPQAEVEVRELSGTGRAA